MQIKEMYFADYNTQIDIWCSWDGEILGVSSLNGTTDAFIIYKNDPMKDQEFRRTVYKIPLNGTIHNEIRDKYIGTLFNYHYFIKDGL